MDPARHRSPGDRAERHVFEAVPDLEAVPRRALALAELTGVGRTGIASDIGLAGPELSATLAVARKALRRSRSELASGGRCERAERALSDRLDGVLAQAGARFLEAHLVRCTRCREHEAELEIALEELRSAFADTAPAGKPAVKKPRAQLRVVPAPPLLPAAPEPPAIEEPAAVAELPAVEEPAAIEAPAALEALPPPDEPVPFPAPPPAPPLPVPLPPAAMARHQRIRAALPVAVAVLVAVGLIAAAIALLSRIGDDPGARAPWDAPNAPLVHPPPLSDQ